VAASDLISSGKASVVLFCAVWAIDPANRAKLNNTTLIKDAAFALHLSSEPITSHAQPCRLVCNDHAATGNPRDDYNFCSNTVEFYRSKKKSLIPFTNNCPDNYFEIL
jgi:hypothetical protein